MSFPLYLYGVAPFYLHRTPTLGPMATPQPASGHFSSCKQTAGRFSTIPMDCRTRASMLQPPTVSYGNTLDRLKRAYLKPSSKPAPFSSEHSSLALLPNRLKTLTPSSSQPLQPFPNYTSNRLVPIPVPPLAKLCYPGFGRTVSSPLAQLINYLN
nr:expressed protein [Hymenolepis microstoma]